MAEFATIARPYAQALFRVAQSEKTSLASWSDFLTEVSQLAARPEIMALARDPNIADQQIASVLLSVAKQPVGEEMNNFIAMLAENNRVTLLPEISEQFQQLKNEHEGAADAVIFSAFDLSETQRNELVSVLEKKFGRKLNPTVSVDASLIGGVRVVIGDEVLDTSVRAKLQQMQIALAA